jgi:hypothetical protein
MRTIATSLAGLAAIAALAVPARAADAVIFPPTTPATLPPLPVTAPAFAGPYWGSSGGVGGFSGIPNRFPVAGTQFGYNVGLNALRVGVEIETETWFFPNPPPAIHTFINARAGFVIGRNIFLYGQFGIGSTLPNQQDPSIAAGGGVEFAVSQSTTIFAEFRTVLAPGGRAWRIVGGVNYYARTGNAAPDDGFDWAGLYYGPFAGALINIPTLPPSSLALLGAQVGYNLVAGHFLFGAEVETYSAASVFVPAAALLARAGFILGRVLLYGEAGVGAFTSQPPFWTAAAGIELALGDRVGLFAEGGVAGTVPQMAAGLNIHFGR